MPAKRKRKRLPQLDTRIINDYDALSEALNELLRDDRQLRRRHREILRCSEAIRRRVDDRTWRALLELEEVEVARFSDALDLVARWAFASGLRIGRKPRQ